MIKANSMNYIGLMQTIIKLSILIMSDDNKINYL